MPNWHEQYDQPKPTASQPHRIGCPAWFAFVTVALIVGTAVVIAVWQDGVNQQLFPAPDIELFNDE